MKPAVSVMVELCVCKYTVSVIVYQGCGFRLLGEVIEYSRADFFDSGAVAFRTSELVAHLSCVVHFIVCRGGILDPEVELIQFAGGNI